MPNRKSLYKDLKKWRKTTNKQQKRYYSKTSYSPNYRKKWSEEEIEAVLAHTISDTELSAIIGRSVKSIQVKRAVTKKHLTNSTHISVNNKSEAEKQKK